MVSLLGLAVGAGAQAPGRRDAERLEPPVGMTLKRIPAGTFVMGLDPDKSSPAAVAVLQAEQPQHRVTISRAFYLGIHEVTQREYEQVMGENPSKFRDSDRLPVERVSWHDAVTFCNKLSARGGNPITGSKARA
jgi:formylglycine-generating enzyme required for sulfatase activity